MSEEKVSTEVVRRVFDDNEGVFIEVGPDCDGLGCVEVRTTNKECQDYFGEAKLTMSPAIARLLGEALIKAADEALP